MIPVSLAGEGVQLIGKIDTGATDNSYGRVKLAVTDNVLAVDRYGVFFAKMSNQHSRHFDLLVSRICGVEVPTEMNPQCVVVIAKSVRADSPFGTSALSGAVLPDDEVIAATRPTFGEVHFVDFSRAEVIILDAAGVMNHKHIGSRAAGQAVKTQISLNNINLDHIYHQPCISVP